MNVNRRTFIGGAALTGVLAASVEAKPRASGGQAETMVMQALERYVEQHRAGWGIPGMTVCVVDRSGFAGFVTSGLADVDKQIPVGPDHLFQIGSISKMFTALAAYSLIDEGKLSPDARLEDVLQGFSVRDGKSITLQHLLNHTAGLPGDSEIFPEGGLRAGFEPGKHWSYSNAGFHLAGKIAAQVDGRPFPDMVDERVLKKLGMTNSVAAIRIADRHRYAQGYEPALTDRLNPRPGIMTAAPWVDFEVAAGCVAATAGDMAIFLRFLLGLAEGKGGALFSDATAARFLANPVDRGGANTQYGNGIARIEVDGRNYLHHTGGMISFCSALHVDSAAGVAAFASANVHYSLNYRPVKVTTYACELLRSLREGGALPAPKPVTIALEQPQRYVGVFTAASGDRFEVIASAGNISMRRNGADSTLQHAEDGLFAATEPDFAVTGVVFDVENEKAVRAWIGDVEYARDPATGYKPPVSEALRMLAGRYDTYSRWDGPIYVYARDGGIWVGNARRLVAIGEDEWRFSEATSPERFCFDNFINGRPHRLLYSGTPYVRVFS